jgi:hypothetical protein
LRRRAALFDPAAALARAALFGPAAALARAALFGPAAALARAGQARAYSRRAASW